MLTLLFGKVGDVLKNGIDIFGGVVVTFSQNLVESRGKLDVQVPDAV